MLKEPSRQEIWKMFDAISPTYDRVNRVMTCGLDQYWRRKVASFLPKRNGLKILDCATGTGDQITALIQRGVEVESVIGVDLAEEMLAIGREKIGKLQNKDKITLQKASALALPFEANTFDAVTISFGIRNVTDVLGALREFYRVLKQGGRVLILEGTAPNNRLLRSIHLLYLRYGLPRIGGWISKNPAAYRYLNETIETFPQGEAFCALLREAGFTHVKSHPFSGGISTLYQGEKDV
ncbi:MAG: bifunctional demethylmenaquinone methyltransferase/2-methoxy-6-polyprenyl-1,4-benzoquinol methylase UbiE [Verrucomicrobia bacterium]|nr:bifunctional demethylmenaquinone methyltransferase/2-methoxy-6-polyprenyl-1,4-benzoquinol methylase UbiE [Verrucomicrobiota bacterium]